MKQKKIVVVSDFVCPYCIIAKAALEEALKRTGIEAEICTQPYELTEEPGERVDTYHDENRKSHYRILEEPARELGLDVKFPPAVVPRPYTRLAFEGWYFAREHGCGEEYADRVYRAYFIDEKDIGDVEVLTDLAKDLGLDAASFRSALDNGVYTKREKEAVAYAKEVMQVSCVPTILIDGRQVELQDYTTEEMIRLLQE